MHSHFFPRNLRLVIGTRRHYWGIRSIQIGPAALLHPTPSPESAQMAGFNGTVAAFIECDSSGQ